MYEGKMVAVFSSDYRVGPISKRTLTALARRVGSEEPKGIVLALNNPVLQFFATTFRALYPTIPLYGVSAPAHLATAPAPAALRSACAEIMDISPAERAVESMEEAATVSLARTKAKDDVVALFIGTSDGAYSEAANRVRILGKVWGFPYGRADALANL